MVLDHWSFVTVAFWYGVAARNYIARMDIRISIVSHKVIEFQVHHPARELARDRRSIIADVLLCMSRCDAMIVRIFFQSNVSVDDVNR